MAGRSGLKARLARGRLFISRFKAAAAVGVKDQTPAWTMVLDGHVQGFDDQFPTKNISRELRCLRGLPGLFLFRA